MRFLPVAFVLSLLFLSLPALAEDYSLPGNGYNNIGLKGELTLDINVTLINLAPYPKFIVVNPFYDFQVYRLSNDEVMVGFKNETSERLVHIPPSDFSKNTLNYRVGFWIYPYETVKVAFRITQAHHYSVQMRDYSDQCGSSVGITVLHYENGTLTGGEIGEDQNLDHPVCGVVYPQLLNSPLLIRFNQILPAMDGYVKMLRYEGKVSFTLWDVPDMGDNSNEFPLFFALSEPVMFYNASAYDYDPPYSMNYTDYLNFLMGYRGFSTAKPTTDHRESKKNGLFKLTDRLISGPSISPSTPEVKNEVNPLDFPVWIVYMGKGVNELEISYRIKWNNYSG